MRKRSNKNDKWKSFTGGRNRKARPRTFKTEAAAHAFAKEQGLESYKLENLKNTDTKDKKYRIFNNS
ncbi:hypothetical protein HZA96_05715 [Candidatus Woesearchaeota archaeon]|nr:hypothetical protein [Candidatus Woesearchaeota archaeon]